jgi:hypothetical protein
MIAKTQNPIISGGSSRPSAEYIEENNLIPLVIDGLKSIFTDKDVIKQINKLNCWSDIYGFISYHISVLSEKGKFDKVQSLKQLIMLDSNLALSYLAEQSKIDDVTIIETFEQVFQSFIHNRNPLFMDCLLQFIENISYGGDALSRLSKLVIQLLYNGYQIKSMNRIVFEKIFRNMDSNEKDKFICYLIANNLISFESIDVILNMESIIIDVSRDVSRDVSHDVSHDVSRDVSHDVSHETNPSIIFIANATQKQIGRMVITCMADLSEKILVAIKENESGGGKLKNLVSVIEILLHRKIVFDMSNVDELTFIKMINNFDNYYSIILMTKNLLNMNDNNLSFLTAKNRILRQQISIFLLKNIHYDAVDILNLNKDERCELLFIYGILEFINQFECHHNNDISNLPEIYFPNFNNERIRYLLLLIMNHPNHKY